MEDVKFVINYDYPNSSEDYIHRIGRTARSTNKGTAYTFFTPGNLRQARELVRVLEEARQAINPKLLQLVDSGRGGGGGGETGRIGGRGQLRFGLDVQSTLWSFWCKSSTAATYEAQNLANIFQSLIATARRCSLVFDVDKVRNVMLSDLFVFYAGFLPSTQNCTVHIPNAWLEKCLCLFTLHMTLCHPK